MKPTIVDAVLGLQWEERTGRKIPDWYGSVYTSNDVRGSKSMGNAVTFGLDFACFRLGMDALLQRTIHALPWLLRFRGGTSFRFRQCRQRLLSQVPRFVQGLLFLPAVPVSLSVRARAGTAAINEAQSAITPIFRIRVSRKRKDP